MLLIGTLLIILLSSFTHYNKTEIKQLVLLGILVLTYTFIIQANVYNTQLLGTAIILYNNMVLLTTYNIIISLVLIVLGLIYLVIIVDYIDYNENVRYYKEFPLLVLVNILSIILFINSNNLILLFVTIELQSYSLYVLTTVYCIPNSGSHEFRYSNSQKHIRLGLIYFLLGSFASIIILLGLSILYSQTNLVNLLDIVNYITNIWGYTDTQDYNIILGIFLVISGLLYKIGIVPLHN
jgi:NADH:ubiquinone oxidoreductase subunit 2 (subunit N)